MSARYFSLLIVTATFWGVSLALANSGVYGCIASPCMDVDQSW